MSFPAKHLRPVSHLVICLFMAVFAVVLMEPINPLGSWKTEVQYGDASIVAYILAWGSHVLTAEPLNYYRIPLGFPADLVLAGVDGMIFQAALVSPFWMATKNVPLVYNMAVYLSFVFSLGASYGSAVLLLRSRFTAVAVAALCTITSDRYFHSNGHVNLLYTGFFPLIFAFTLKALESGSRKWCIAAAVAFGLSVYASNYLFVLGSLILLVAGIVFVFTQRFQVEIYQLKRFMAIGLLGGMLAFPIPLIHWTASRDISSGRADITTAAAFEATVPGWLKPPNRPQTIISRDAKIMGLPPEENPRGEDCQFIGFLVGFGLILETLRLFSKAIDRKWNKLDTISACALVAGIFFVLASFGPYVRIGDRQFPGPYMLLYKGFLQYSGFFRIPSRLAFITEWLFALSIGIGFVSLLGKYPLCRGVACTIIVLGSWLEHVSTESVSRFTVQPSPLIAELDRLDPGGKEALVVLPDPGSLGPTFFSTTTNWRPVANAWPDNPLLTDYTWFFAAVEDLKSSRTGALLAQRKLQWVIASNEQTLQQAKQSSYLSEISTTKGQSLFRIKDTQQLIALREREIKARLSYITRLRAETATPSILALTVGNSLLQPIFGYMTTVTSSDSELLLTPTSVGLASANISFPEQVEPSLYDELQVDYALEKASPHAVSLYWASPTIPITERTHIMTRHQGDGPHYRAVLKLSNHPDWLWQDRLTGLRFDVSDILVDGADRVRINKVTFRRRKPPASLHF